MNEDIMQKLVGWPDNTNTFLLKVPDGVRLVVLPDSIGEELAMMSALDWSYAKYGPAVSAKARLVWRLRRWNGCRTTGFADWLDGAKRFFAVRSVVLLDGRGRVMDEIGLEEI